MSQWEGVMQNHAKSFYLASLFFPRSLLPKVKALYALCRWLDDAVDEAPNQQQALQNLNEISQDLSSENSQMLVNQFYKANQLDIGYINDLIDGARQDMEVVRIKNQDELIQYSYKVAGTVGLAMFDLMKVSPPVARCHAVDLGVAMQITNICRDVKEDRDKNRIYVPLELLNHHNISQEQFFSDDFSEEQIVAVTKDMLALADHYYHSASLAFNNIPWRTRGAIIIASDLYRSIGQKLLKKGGNPMKGRTWLTRWEKSWVVGRSLLRWVVSGRKRQHLDHDASLHDALKPWKQLRGFAG